MESRSVPFTSFTCSKVSSTTAMDRRLQQGAYANAPTCGDVDTGDTSSLGEHFSPPVVARRHGCKRPINSDSRTTSLNDISLGHQFSFSMSAESIDVSDDLDDDDTFGLPPKKRRKVSKLFDNDTNHAPSVPHDSSTSFSTSFNAFNTFSSSHSFCNSSNNSVRNFGSACNKNDSNNNFDFNKIDTPKRFYPTCTNLAANSSFSHDLDDLDDVDESEELDDVEDLDDMEMQVMLANLQAKVRLVGRTRGQTNQNVQNTKNVSSTRKMDGYIQNLCNSNSQIGSVSISSSSSNISGRNGSSTTSTGSIKVSNPALSNIVADYLKNRSKPNMSQNSLPSPSVPSVPSVPSLASVPPATTPSAPAVALPQQATSMLLARLRHLEASLQSAQSVQPVQRQQCQQSPQSYPVTSNATARVSNPSQRGTPPLRSHNVGSTSTPIVPGWSLNGFGPLLGSPPAGYTNMTLQCDNKCKSVGPVSFQSKTSSSDANKNGSDLDSKLKPAFMPMVSNGPCEDVAMGIESDGKQTFSWYVEICSDGRNRKIKCPKWISRKLSNASLFETVEYQLDGYQYWARKICHDAAQQTNQATQKTRILRLQADEPTVLHYIHANPADHDQITCKIEQLFYESMSDRDYEITCMEPVSFPSEAERLQQTMYEAMLRSRVNRRKERKRAQQQQQMQQQLERMQHTHHTHHTEGIDNNLDGIEDDPEHRCKRYDSEMDQMDEMDELGEEDIERVLFHGTNREAMEKILINGFNRDFNTRSLFGKGVYFARDASYSHDYCVADRSKLEYHMLVCRVIVGDYCLGKGDMDTAPARQDSNVPYDSLVDSLSDPSIFVVCRDYQSVPYYIIKYRRKPRYDTISFVKDQSGCVRCTQGVDMARKEIVRKGLINEDNWQIDGVEADLPYLDEISKYLRENDDYSVSPKLIMKKNAKNNNNISIDNFNLVPQSDCVEYYQVVMGHRPDLFGTRGLRAKCKILRYTCLGQYFGVEYLANEFKQVFNDTWAGRSKSQSLTFVAEMPSDPSNSLCSVSSARERAVQVVMDVNPEFGCKETNLLTYVQDCRARLDSLIMNREDRLRENAKFVKVTANGWPMFFLVATRDIESGEPIMAYRSWR